MGGSAASLIREHGYDCFEDLVCRIACTSFINPWRDSYMVILNSLTRTSYTHACDGVCSSGHRAADRCLQMKRMRTWCAITWVWISSLMDRLVSCFFLTASRSTRGRMVIPYITTQHRRGETTGDLITDKENTVNCCCIKKRRTLHLKLRYFAFLKPALQSRRLRRLLLLTKDCWLKTVAVWIFPKGGDARSKNTATRNTN